MNKLQQQEPDYNICPTCGGMASDPIVPPEHWQQEPVAQKIWEEGDYGPWITELKDIPVGAFLYTSPPAGARTEDGCSTASKPWVGLTDEELIELDCSKRAYRAIEAKLLEKNA